MAADSKHNGIGAWVDAKSWRGLLYFALRDGKWVCVKVDKPAGQFFKGWPSTQVREFCQKCGWEFRRIGKVEV